MSGFAAFGADVSPDNPLPASDQVAWAGLDFSLVRMIGPNDFRHPDAIFPPMFASWNSLFDGATREVIFSGRETGRAGGFGFCDCRFGVVKNVDSNLRKRPPFPKSSK
jgi:hypothetical protein